MKRAFDVTPDVGVDRRSAKPLHRQLYESYREAIASGRLKAGQRLPSSRSLAEELGISRVPAVTAFEQLLAEGFVEGRVGAGTFVSARLEQAAPPPRKFPKGTRRIAPPFDAIGEGPSAPWLGGTGPFRLSHPALDHLPLKTWSAIVARQARRQSRRSYAYGDPAGLRELRDVIARYLTTSRGVRCEASQVMVVSGSQQALCLCARVLVPPGAPVWLEEPGYQGARAALASNGARMVPIRVDAEGLDLAWGIEHAPAARAVYVTPSHQFPLGITMSARRRLQLLEWGRRAGGWIIEDDYDAEYRYESAPVAALHALDADERVIYVGTFSKVLFPALRIGYLVIPHDLMTAFAQARDAIDIFPAPLLQTALTEFISEGHFARHLRRMRLLYRARRAALVAALRDAFGDRAKVLGAEAGIHLVATFSPPIDDVQIARRAALAGVWAMPLSSCYAAKPFRSGLVLGYGGSSEARTREAVAVLAKIITLH